MSLYGTMLNENVTDVITKLGELLELQTTVYDVVLQEGENVTVHMEALSVIVNKTLEQACQWVRIVG